MCIALEIAHDNERIQTFYGARKGFFSRHWICQKTRPKWQRMTATRQRLEPKPDLPTAIQGGFLLISLSAICNISGFPIYVLQARSQFRVIHK
jgi:hypothetical protein